MCKLNFISITARPQPEDTLPTILDLSDYYYFDEKKKEYNRRLIYKTRYLFFKYIMHDLFSNELHLAHIISTKSDRYCHYYNILRKIKYYQRLRLSENTRIQSGSTF